MKVQRVMRFLHLYFFTQKIMKKLFISAIVSLSALSVFAQKPEDKKPVETTKPTATVTAKDSLGTVEVKADTVAIELAKSAVKAHGGDKFKGMLTLAVKGTADFSVEGQSFTLASSFYTAYAGDKYRIELNNPFQPFKQTFDGEQTVSSGGRGMSLPPINRLGFPLLQNIDKPGFVVSPLPEEKKKKKTGFRMTSPDGFFTDFFVDEKTGQVKAYESTYVINEVKSSTSVEVDKYRDVEGILIPEKYSQRFEFGAGFVVYTAFKAKDIFVNTKLEDDVFAAPK
jgi:hypothetical protein